MERPVIVSVGADGDRRLQMEVWPMGSRPSWKEDADIGLLQRRFPGHCPHHLLHNLLQLHYGRHQLCTAAPFSVEMCRHGTHAKPELTPEQMRANAPAEGALLLLPFGLSCRACDDDVGLVAGCAECELLDEDDFCGGCRRVWSGGCPFPATQLLHTGRLVELEEWQRAVGLGEQQVPCAGGPAEPEECSEEEWWGEEEWEDEEEEDWEDEAEEWKDAEEAEVGTASWGAEADGDYGGGDDGWQAQEGPADAEADSWGAGHWVEDRWGSWAWDGDAEEAASWDAEEGGVWDDAGGGWDGHGGPADDDGGGDSEEVAGDWGAGRWVEDRSGNWSWVVNFTPAAASTVHAADAPAQDSAAVAASAATAAVQAVLAAGAAQAAPAPAGSSAAASDVSERIRILELELELERLKRRRLV